MEYLLLGILLGFIVWILLALIKGIWNLITEHLAITGSILIVCGLYYLYQNNPEIYISAWHGLMAVFAGIKDGIIWIGEISVWALSGIWSLTKWVFVNIGLGIAWLASNLWDALTWILWGAWGIIEWVGIQIYAIGMFFLELIGENLMTSLSIIFFIAGIILLLFITYRAGYGSISALIKNIIRTKTSERLPDSKRWEDERKPSLSTTEGAAGNIERQTNKNIIMCCPKCDGKLAFPGNAHLRVTCKHCANIFEVKNGKIIAGSSLDRILSSIASSIQKLGLSKNENDELIGAIDSLIESYTSPLLVTVLGEFSSGKSTFINALLREKLLAMKQRETTATITKLQFGKKRQLTVHFKDNTKKTFDIADDTRSMDEYVVESEENEILDKVRYVTLELDSPLLHHLDLADTPGFNSNYNRHTEITKDFIRYSDLVLWLFDARKMGKASEIKVISEHCKYLKPIGIVNWVNKLPLKEGETPASHLKLKLDQYAANFEKFFFISAYDGLNAVNGEYKTSGMQDVVDYFLQVVIPECNTRKNTAIIQRLRNIGSEIVRIQKTLTDRKSLITGMIDNFNAHVNAYQELEKKYEEVTKNWNKDVMGDASKMIEHFDRYFIDNEIPISIEKRQKDYCDRNTALKNTLRSINSSSNAIEKERIQLSHEFSSHQGLVSDYYNNHQVKAFFEDLFEVSVSKEKIAINTSANRYQKHENEFNAKVNAFNRKVGEYNEDMEQFNDSIINFINNTVLPARDGQSKWLEALAKKIDREWDGIQKLNSESETITKQLVIIEKEINKHFAEVLKIIAKDKSVSFENMDLKSVLKQIDAESVQSKSLDWSHIYSRNKMDKFITNKVSTIRSARAGAAETEQNTAQTIK